MATFTNQATLSYNGTTTNSNLVTGTLQEALTATKTAVSGTYAPGDDVTYIISIVNDGTAPLTDLTVTDNLGAYTYETETLVPLTYTDASVTYYVNGALQTAPTVTAGPPLVVSGLDVPAGGNALLIYEASVNQYAPPEAGSTIVNTASIAGTGVPAEVEVSETVTAAEEANLTITKSLTPEVVTGDGPLTYTFTIQNTGNTAATAEDTVVLTDTFDPVLSGLQSTLENGADVPSERVPFTAYTYNETTGEFASTAGAITVPAATYTQTGTGEWVATPGVTTLVVTGTV